MSTVAHHAPSVSTNRRAESPGPTGPQQFVMAPEGGLSSFRPARPAWMWFAGAHGGAGESTLAALLPNAEATGHRWPICEEPAPVVLVARTSAAGLLAARTALIQWAAPATGIGESVHLLGLVLSPDAPGRLPKPLRELAEQVVGGAPRAWHLPWVEEWRTGDSAGHKPTVRLFADLAQLTQP